MIVINEGKALAIAQEAKMLEIDAHANDLVETAYANPVQGITTDPIRYRAKLEIYRRHNLDLMSIDQALSSGETDQAVISAVLSGYEVDIVDDAEIIKDIIMALSTSDQVNALDVPSQDWTLWVPS